MRTTMLTVAAAATLLIPAAPASASTIPRHCLEQVGDSWTQGVGDRVPSDGLGPAPVTAKLLGVPFDQDGKGGSGYANSTTYGPNRFATRLWRHPVNECDLVIIQGSTNDKAYRPVLAGRANETLKVAKARNPRALIVVVGPVSISGSNDAQTQAVRGKLRAAAAYAGVPFIDGIGEGWFRPGDWTRYHDDATGHPNNAGYRVVAEHVASDVANLGYGQ